MCLFFLKKRERKEKKMQTFAHETETICNQFKGVLMRDAYSHPKLKELESQMSQRLRENTKICAIAKQPCLVLYNRRNCYVVRDQLLLHKDAVPPESDFICLAFFNTQLERLQFKDYYLLPRAQWDKVTVVQSCYKPLNLQHLARINLFGDDDEVAPQEPLSPQSLSSSSTTITDDEVGENPEEGVPNPALTMLGPFWIHTYIDGMTAETNAPNEYLYKYIQLILDLVVWRRYYSDDERLKRKTILYYARNVEHHHNAMTLLFASQMAEHSGRDVSEGVHRGRKDCGQGEWFMELANTRLSREWIDTQMALFRECRWYSLFIEETTLYQLYQHIAFIRHAMPRSLWPGWFSYTIEGGNGVYWMELADCTYVVKAEWILKPAFDPLVYSLVIEKGYAQLSPQIFQTVFLPLLYQCVLEDTHQYLLYVYHAGDVSTNVARDTLRHLRDAYSHTREEMKELDALLQKYSLYNPQGVHTLAAEVGDISSPVMRKMVKTRPEFDLSRSTEEMNASVKWFERHIRREDVPDIEDLGNKKLAPPCMQRVFGREQRPYMGHSDRMNVIKYLIDMAYSREEVVEFLCRGHQQDKADYQLLIGNIYDSFLKEKRINRRQLIYTQHHSFGCSSLINTVPQQAEKNFLRCQFAVDYEATNNTPRRKYNHTEKDAFRLQCGATLAQPLKWGTKHPVQYTLQRINL